MPQFLTTVLGIPNADVDDESQKIRQTDRLLYHDLRHHHQYLLLCVCAVNNLRCVVCGITFLLLLYIVANLIYSGLDMSDLIKVVQVAKQLKELSFPQDCRARTGSEVETAY